MPQNDCRDGTGTCKYTTSEVYEGGWKADKRDGHGVAKYTSGDKYEGEWRFGKRDGRVLPCHCAPRDAEVIKKQPWNKISLSA